MEVTKNDVFIHADHEEKNDQQLFYEKLDHARANREAIRKRIREYLSDPEVQAMYRDPEVNMDLEYNK